MKRLTAICLLLFLITLSACSSAGIASPSSKLTVTQTLWSGWAEKQPEPTVTVYEEIAKGTVVYDEVIGGKITVDNCTDESISFRLENSCFVIPNDNGTINLTATPTEAITILRGEEKELVTATTDAGVSLTIRFD